MDGFAPILVAIITTAGTIAGIALGARRLGKLGLGDAQLQVNQTLRELVDVTSAKADIWKEKYDQEVLAHAADRALAVSDKQVLVEKLRLTQHDLDDCERQKDGLYSELRALLERSKGAKE